MYIYTPLCRYWIALYRYVLVYIVPHVDIELEDNKQFISNIPRMSKLKIVDRQTDGRRLRRRLTVTDHNSSSRAFDSGELNKSVKKESPTLFICCPFFAFFSVKYNKMLFIKVFLETVVTVTLKFFRL